MHPSEIITKQLTGGVSPYGQPDRKISVFVIDDFPYKPRRYARSKLETEQQTVPKMVLLQFQFYICSLWGALPGPCEWCSAATWGAWSTWWGRTLTLGRTSKPGLFMILQGADADADLARWWCWCWCWRRGWLIVCVWSATDNSCFSPLQYDNGVWDGHFWGCRKEVKNIDIFSQRDRGRKYSGVAVGGERWKVKYLNQNYVSIVKSWGFKIPFSHFVLICFLSLKLTRCRWSVRGRRSKGQGGAPCNQHRHLCHRLVKKLFFLEELTKSYLYWGCLKNGVSYTNLMMMLALSVWNWFNVNMITPL